MTTAERYAALPTAAKLLLILSAVLLPIGAALVWLAESGIRQADHASREISEDQARAAARSIESLIARNALALRVAANGALAGGPAGACERAQNSLGVAPGVAQRFELNSPDGQPLCAIDAVAAPGDFTLVAPGAIRLRLASGRRSLIVRVGVIGGMATAAVPASELRSVALDRNSAIEALAIQDGDEQINLLEAKRADGDDPRDDLITEWPLGN